MVHDGVERDGGLSGLPIADDELPLTAADRNHRVDRLDPGLQRLLHGLSCDDSRRFQLDTTVLRACDRPFAIDRDAKRIDDTAPESLTDRHLGDASRPTDFVTLADRASLTEKHRSDIVLFEVQHHAEDFVGKLQQLAGGGLVQSVDARDAVTTRKDDARLADLELSVVLCNLLLDDVADFGGANLHR